jgi:general secretion pathway protein M
MIRISQHAHRALAFAILIGLLLVGYFGVIAPIIDEYATTRQELTNARARLLRASTTARHVDRLRAQLATLEKGDKNQDEFLQAASESLAAAQLQNQLKVFIDGTQGELRSTQILPSKKDGNLTRVSLRAQMSGTLANVQSVLYALESFSPRLFVDNLDIRARPQNRGHAGQGPVMLDVRFDLFGYMRGATTS